MQSDDLGLVERLRKGAELFEAVLAMHANAEGGDAEPHWSSQAEAEEAHDLATEAAAAIERLVAERDEARRDAERLDFLDKCNAALNAHYGTTYRWRLILNHNVNRLMLGHMAVDLSDMHADGLPSCRDAIDRARQALGETP